MGNSFPQELVERINDRTDIVQLIGEQIKLEKKGKDFWGLCPFHSERTPSFSVSQEKQMYYCFGCHAGGNSVSFLMEHNKLTFPEAIEQLADRAGIDLPRQEDDGRVLEARKQRERALRLMAWASEVYHRHLQNPELGRVAREYLHQRGVSPQIIDELKLGVSLGGSSLIQKAAQQGIDAQELIGVGLAGQSDTGQYDRFRGRIMFPIRDRRGRVIAFGGRILGDGQPKYLNSPENPLFNKSRELYGLDRAGKSISSLGYAIIVEGYMDAIMAWQYGVDNVVASMGTALSIGHAQILKRYSEKVSLCFDADGAGQAAALRGMDVLQKAGFEVRVAVLDEGLDPDDYLRRFGQEAFVRLTRDDAMHLVEYRLDRLAADADLGTPEGLGQFSARAADVLAQIENEVARQSYVSLLVGKYRIPEGPFLSELRKRLGTRDRSQQQKPGVTPPPIVIKYSPGWQKAAGTLILLMARNPAMRRIVFEVWSRLGFADKRHEDIAKWLLNDIGDADPQGLMHELPHDLQSELARAFNQVIMEGNPVRVANDCFVKIEEHQLDISSQRLMREAESAGDQNEKNGLRQQAQEVMKKKKSLRERPPGSQGGIYLE
ncbi:MAG TPA: DNA primase [Bacillota bacterium]|nr:DNA primase [Bacillota bacterium]